MTDTPVSDAADALTMYRAVTDQEDTLRQHYAGVFVDWALVATYNDMRAKLETGEPDRCKNLVEALSDLQLLYETQTTFESRPDDTMVNSNSAASTIEDKIKDTMELIVDTPLYEHRPPRIPPRWLPPVRFALALEARRGPDRATENVVMDAMLQARDLRSRLPGTAAWLAAKGRRVARGLQHLSTLYIL
jgi:hypothetical protein